MVPYDRLMLDHGAEFPWSAIDQRHGVRRISAPPIGPRRGAPNRASRRQSGRRARLPRVQTASPEAAPSDRRADSWRPLPPGRSGPYASGQFDLGHDLRLARPMMPTVAACWPRCRRPSPSLRSRPCRLRAATACWCRSTSTSGEAVEALGWRQAGSGITRRLVNEVAFSSATKRTYGCPSTSSEPLHLAPVSGRACTRRASTCCNECRSGDRCHDARTVPEVAPPLLELGERSRGRQEVASAAGWRPMSLAKTRTQQASSCGSGWPED